MEKLFFKDISHLCEAEVQSLFEKGLISNSTLYEYYTKVSVWTRNLGCGSSLWDGLNYLYK